MGDPHPFKIRDSWRIYLRGFRRLLIPRRRRFHAFALGTAKSGTHSLAGLFSGFRTEHEPSAIELNTLLAHEDLGAHFERKLRRWLTWRDRAMGLEMESNCFLSHYADSLVKVLPEARYILLFREPRSWVRSWINHTINRREQPGSVWDRALEAIYRPDDHAYGFEESVFVSRGLYPLSSYLHHWRDLNEKLLAALPAERTLLVPTAKISESIDALARHVGVEPDSLSRANSHLFHRASDHRVIEALDGDLLDELIETICGDTYSRLLGRYSGPEASHQGEDTG